MNIYQHQRELGAFVESFAKGGEHIQPKLARPINA